MNSASYSVRGLTCGACMAEVMENVRAIAGVTGLTVDLVPGGVSYLRVSLAGSVETGEVPEAIRRSGFFDVARARPGGEERRVIGMLRDRASRRRFGTQLMDHSDVDGGTDDGSQ